LLSLPEDGRVPFEERRELWFATFQTKPSRLRPGVKRREKLHLPAEGTSQDAFSDDPNVTKQCFGQFAALKDDLRLRHITVSGIRLVDE
jgi:hypothetical protein